MSEKKTKNIRIKEKVIKGKIGDKETEIKIRTKDDKGQDIEFDKDNKSTKKLNCEYQKKGDGDKWTDKWESFDSDVEWTGGFVFNGAKLKPENNKVSDVELKDEVKANMGFFGTPTIPTWIGFVIIFIGIVALIWWWIASSNKEDKEEESL